MTNPEATPPPSRAILSRLFASRFRSRVNQLKSELYHISIGSRSITEYLHYYVKSKEGESVELPEAIIQHIQSFLNGTEAAQTSLLSKSWYTAWLTRPSLDFDHKYFGDTPQCPEIRFWNFVNKTVERYDKLNLRIHSLRLCIDGHSKQYSCSNVSKLIIKALNMGATSLDLNLFLYDTYTPYTLPHQVLGSENLNTLSVSRCKIDGKVSCSRLKSLTLNRAIVEGGTIYDIISSCPLIENLSLSPWNEMPALSPFNEVGKRIVGSGPFNKLKCLLLSRVEVHSLFFNDFSSRFPCLKDLSIHYCRCYQVIQISSPSLECINIKEDNINILRMKFDVPCIRNFTFYGSCSSALTFKTTSRSNWDASIHIYHYFPPIGDSWFLQLNEFLKKLSQSKVSLTLQIMSKANLDYAFDLQGLTKPQVENLTISGPHSVSPATFHTLFQLCRPIYITQYWLPEFSNINGKKRFNDFMEFVYKRMIHQIGFNSCIAYQRMLSGGECDLEEVSVEFYDESVSAWCPTSPEADEQRLRLHLTWRRH
ncbi:hypothetical protein ACS0TY_009888 [Phlomoides rotata]